MVAVCTWAPLNAASAQVNVIANGPPPVDLFTFPPPLNFNSLRAVNGGEITNSGTLPVNVTITQTQYGVLAGGPGVLSTIGTITLNGINVFASDVIPPTYTVAPASGPRGLAAEGVGAVLNATNFNINLSHTGSTSAQNGTGLRVVNGGRLTATGGIVTMTGAWNHGIVASDGIVDTNAAIIVNGGATSGQAYGAFAIGEAVSQFGPSTIFLRPGSSVTNHHNNTGIGLYALNFPQGTPNIDSYATVFTDGAMNGYGALAQNGGRILLHGGSVTTTGTQGHGLYSFAPRSLIVADAAFGGVQTSGNTAHGARATGGVIELNGTTILTTGAGSHGIFAEPNAGLGGKVYPTGAIPAVAAGDVAVIFNGNVTASGNLSHGIFANASTGGNAYVETSSTVMGGWGAGASGIRLDGLNDFARINTGSTVGALSDLAISGTTTGVGGTIQIENAGTITGYVTLAAGNDTFSNLSPNSFDIRNFADTNGDGVRDTKGVAISDFGAGNDQFLNEANGVVRLLPVTGAATTNATGYYVPTTGLDSRPLEASFYDLNREGVVQGQLVNLETFSNAGTIDLRNAAVGNAPPVVGNTLVITGNAAAGGAPGTGLYVSNGGRLLVNTVLNGGIPVGGQTNSYSDMLIVDRTQLGAGGATAISVTNVGGSGALTPGNGIELVEVRNKTASDAAAFALAGDFVTNAGPASGGRRRLCLYAQLWRRRCRRCRRQLVSALATGADNSRYYASRYRPSTCSALPAGRPDLRGLSAGPA